jgi:hypothetical protein
MTDSSGSRDPAGPDTSGLHTPGLHTGGLHTGGLDRLTLEASFAQAQAAAAPQRYDADAPAFLPTETVGPRPTGEAAWGHTPTEAAWQPDSGLAPSVPSAGHVSDQAAPGGYPEIRRYGPGVPAVASAVLSADEIWRTGQRPASPSRGHWWRWAGSAFSVALLIASGVLIYLRLQHGPLAVTGVAITAEQKNGCAVNVTGRIGISGGAGTVSYQWVFTPQAAAPQPLSQAVAAGQSAVYVTAAVQGQGHGTLAQQVTLQVLGPGHGSAATKVTVSC